MHHIQLHPSPATNATGHSTLSFTPPTHPLCENLRRYSGKPMDSTQLHTSRMTHNDACRCIASVTATSRRCSCVKVPRPRPPDEALGLGGGWPVPRPPLYGLQQGENEGCGFEQEGSAWQSRRRRHWAGGRLAGVAAIARV